MLLLHQSGSVKIGEVVRYTVTYTPSADRILPSPEFLYLRIKNTCAIALRAAFVHGPYTLSVAAYPSHFDPNEKFEEPRRYGVPEFEPMLKAGATWNCHLVVPDNIRQCAGEGSSQHGFFGKGPEHDGESVSWIIEVASQVVFSTSAAVHYEVLLARDEKSLNLGSVVPVMGGHVQAPQPGRVSDFQQSAGAIKDHPAQQKGVFSRAVHLKVEDTAALWNTPQLPGWDDMGWLRARSEGGADAPVEPVMASGKPEDKRPKRPFKQKKVHLVILTHGLHSNLGADMLFLKESIDAGVRKAKADAQARKARERAAKKKEEPSTGTDPAGTSTRNVPEVMVEGVQDDEEEDEEVVVRGFSGNATRTERGIKYLGKRLARHILSMTYPDQPCLPTAKAASEAIAATLKASSQKKGGSEEAHKHSTIHHAPSPSNRSYKFTKISFIGHSLGGLVQTYAVAYIQKHSPQFFDLIEPINFIAMASPFLGLNHENPLYVKFALDFGLVGRTGQDLGLTWRAPTIARNGWGALVGNLGEQAHKRVYGEAQPESKPLLRILPTGPAHKALKKFRNRTVYSNVVNDGIVPLRTSCLLFLDWQGLGRVEKARREVGLVEAVVQAGWAELTGANVTTPRLAPWSPVEDNENNENEANETGKTTPTDREELHEVPQPPTNAMLEDDRQSLRSAVVSPFQEQPASADLQKLQSSTTSTANPLSGLFNFFRTESPKPQPPPSPKISKIYQRSQTLKIESDSTSVSLAASSTSKVTSGTELGDEVEGLTAPPRTSIFESAGDLLNPKLPTVEYLIDPSKRHRTIFHDRIYHPSDIPPAPVKDRTASSLQLRRRSLSRSSRTAQSEGNSPLPSPGIAHKDTGLSQQSEQSAKSAQSVPVDYESTVNPAPTTSHGEPTEVVDSSQMRVEEKIARAYHRGLSWRKVLVKLEPDAHNNIVVRRMFANAFGWPVIHHLVQSHFSDEAMAKIRDEHEPGVERAKGLDQSADETGKETKETIRGHDHRGRTVTVREGDAAQDDDIIDAERYDVVPELAPSPRSPRSLSRQGSSNALGVFPTTGASPTTSNRPPIDRYDSMSWSDRDWADSADESDENGGGGSYWSKMAAQANVKKPPSLPRTRTHPPVPSPSTTPKPGDTVVTNKGKTVATSSGNLGDQQSGPLSPTTAMMRSVSPLSWNWTEKIVGRGKAATTTKKRTSRSLSPGPSTPTKTTGPTTSTPGLGLLARPSLALSHDSVGSDVATPTGLTSFEEKGVKDKNV
ncbi:putative serine esterase-domain-containing protein [Triangularia verruculosa]|uniref:Serine esterase-domain-containing protein n=1 Tax=Triangularia verruculosa TaxID=2587418 RepID=A0AAN6XQY6_9PEZI|nr:putative serine esterase-domain-containing protein [Triangularia verruculosa]